MLQVITTIKTPDIAGIYFIPPSQSSCSMPGMKKAPKQWNLANKFDTFSLFS
jgi:hypothetical protein